MGLFGLSAAFLRARSIKAAPPASQLPQAASAPSYPINSTTSVSGASLSPATTPLSQGRVTEQAATLAVPGTTPAAASSSPNLLTYGLVAGATAIVLIIIVIAVRHHKKS